MLLHGTNQPLPLGTAITSSGSRKAKPSFSGSWGNAVYAVDTEFVPPYDAITLAESDLLFYDEHIADGLTPATQALSSAISYAVQVAWNHNVVHPESKYAGGSSEEFYASYTGVEELERIVDDRWVERWNKQRTDDMPLMLDDNDWQNLSEADQEAYDQRWTAYYAEKKDAPPLRGIWVYEVEQVGGFIEKDSEGQHHSDMRIRQGYLKVVNCVIWDGALVDDSFELPPISGTYADVTDEDIEELEEWYENDVSVPHNSLRLPVETRTASKSHKCMYPLRNGGACIRPTLNGRCWQHA
jgi:hypothetical protein